MRNVLAILACVAVGLSACSDSSSTDTPGSPTPSVTSLAVTGTAPAVGATAQFTATATLSDNTTQNVTAQATWASSNTAIATVTGTGTVAGVSAGDVDIRATYQTFTGTRPITIGAQTACAFSVGPTSINMRSGGESGTFTVSVTQGTNCSWTATSLSAFVTVTSGASGVGNGAVIVAAAPNTGAFRSGTLTIAGQTVTVTQDAFGVCVTSLSPTSQSFGISGGMGTVTVTAPDTCGWAVSTIADFITVAPGTRGTGNGTFAYTVAANATGSSRQGTISVGGIPLSVRQDGGPCVISVSPATFSLDGREWGHSLAPLFADVTTSVTGCNWTALSDVAWIVPIQTQGNNTSFAVEVAQNNTGATRNGTITVNDRTVPVVQASYAQLSLSFSAMTVGTGAASIAFTVVSSGDTGTATGFWKVATSSLFLHVKNPCISSFDCAGSKSGTIDIDANATGAARTATVTLNVGRANLIVPLVSYTITQTAQ